MLDRDTGPGLLARSLATLARTQSTGTLTVSASGGLGARLVFSDGRLESVETLSGSGRVLGDVLVNEGSANASACVDDRGRAADEPIGRYLVRCGRASEGAVDHAIRIQMRARLASVFAWVAPALRFEPCAANSNQEGSGPSTADTVLHALRLSAPTSKSSDLLRELGHEKLGLTDFGRELLGAAALRPEESAVFAMLGRGATGAVLASTFVSSSSALAFAVILRRIRAVEPAGSDARYSLLLRKHRELRRSTDAARLLDVPPDASAVDARRALRILARDLHPDRFGAATDTAARAVSGEVLKALVQAEAELVARRRVESGRRAK